MRLKFSLGHAEFKVIQKFQILITNRQWKDASTSTLNNIRAGTLFYSFCHVSSRTGPCTRKYSTKDLIQLTVLFWKGQKAQEKEHNQYQNVFSSLFNQNSAGTRNIHKCLQPHQSRTEIICLEKNRINSKPYGFAKVF